MCKKREGRNVLARYLKKKTEKEKRKKKKKKKVKKGRGAFQIVSFRNEDFMMINDKPFMHLFVPVAY